MGTKVGNSPVQRPPGSTPSPNKPVTSKEVCAKPSKARSWLGQCYNPGSHMPHGRACLKPHSHSVNSGSMASSCGQPLLFTFSTCQCPAHPSGPSPHVKGCLNLSESSTMLLAPRPEPALDGKCNCATCTCGTRNDGFARLANMGLSCTTCLPGTVMGEPVGDEAAAAWLVHPSTQLRGCVGGPGSGSVRGCAAACWLLAEMPVWLLHGCH